MRCFVALAIPDEIRGALERVAQTLRPRLSTARWVRPDHLHLTLAFLGDIDENEAGRMRAGLEARAADPPVDAVLTGLGAFPQPAAAHVLWAGLADPKGRLAGLAGRVREAAANERVGKPDRKPFVPHLTLARFRRPCDLRHIDLSLPPRDTGSGPCRIDRVVFMRSRLTPAGPEYQPLQVVRLSAAG